MTQIGGANGKVRILVLAEDRKQRIRRVRESYDRLDWEEPVALQRPKHPYDVRLQVGRRFHHSADLHLWRKDANPRSLEILKSGHRLPTIQNAIHQYPQPVAHALAQPMPASLAESPL